MLFNNKKTCYGLILIIIIALAFITYRVFFHKTPDKHPTKLLTVKLFQVMPRNEPLIVKAYGKAISPKSLPIHAQFSGLVQHIAVKTGQIVKQGQVLFIVKTTGVAGQVKATAAALAQAKNQYNKDARLYQLNQNSIAKITLQNARDQYHLAQAQYQKALSKYQASTITAPINGKLTIVNVAQGQYITSNTNLAKLIHPQVVVQYALPSKWYPHLKQGQSITFSTQTTTKQEIPGAVTYISPQQNTDYEITLRATLKQPVMPNSFGQITQIINANQQQLAIPQKYTYTDDEGYYVYTIDQVDHKSQLKKQYFKPRFFYANGWVSVQSGLKAGQQIVASKDTSLTPGQFVKVVQS